MGNFFARFQASDRSSSTDIHIDRARLLRRAMEGLGLRGVGQHAPNGRARIIVYFVVKCCTFDRNDMIISRIAILSTLTKSEK